MPGRRPRPAGCARSYRSGGPDNHRVRGPRTGHRRVRLPRRPAHPAGTATTIRAPGWARATQPPPGFTDALKTGQIGNHYDRDTRAADYSEGYVIAPDLGGAPRAGVNFFPEPPARAAKDDILEAILHSRVCAGQLALAAAQIQLFLAKVASGYAWAARAT